MVTVPQRALMALVRGYRLMLSPWLGSGCRFEPTCSAYSLRALEMHGAAAGAYLTACRVLRCQPLCAGGYDPVPEHAPALFRHLLATGAPLRHGPPSTSSDKTAP